MDKATFIKAARKLLPTHPAVLICFHLPYAGHFFEIPNLGFNIFQRALVGFWGSRFLRKAQRANRPVLAWTVNDERWMEWCIRRNAAGAHSGVEKDAKTSLIDGVITDDPKLFREVCERWEDEQSGLRPARWRLFGGGVRNSLGVLWDLWIFTFFSRYFFFQGRRMGRFDYFKDVKKLQ